MLLALDTATDAVTVAVHDGATLRAERSRADRLRHGELLAPVLAEALAAAEVTPADLTRIAVGVGPGPFTGLRIGLVTATTMAAALGIEAVGVCSLDVVAAAVAVSGPFVVATDARRREVYWARYADARTRSTDPAVAHPPDVPTGLPVAGNGPALYPESFPNAVGPRLPSAATLAAMVVAGHAWLLPTLPLYLRRPDAAEPGPGGRVSAR